MKHDQDAIKQDYRASGVFKGKKDADNLHMFFSPYRIPSGLTDFEIRLCLDVHQTREQLSEKLLKKRKSEIKSQTQERLEQDFAELEKERLALSVLWGEKAFSKTAEEVTILHAATDALEYIPIPLPSELLEDPMTRESFDLGIEKLKIKMKECK